LLPLVLILGGNGEFNTPYQVNYNDDILAMSLTRLYPSYFSK
jgi:hypothetical protein